jgi:hypothetical protein
MSQKRTPWFPGHVQPARPGVYERRLPGISGIKVCYFDGKTWRVYATTAREARRQREASMFQSGARWRGLANQPGRGR